MVFPLSLSHAEEKESVKLQMKEAVVGSGMKDLTPEGVSETFTSSVGTLYAFSYVSGISEETQIKHLWFYGDTLMAEVVLRVKPTQWRTYSSKNVLPQWTGEWRVDMTSDDGLVLGSVRFTVESSQ